MVVVIDLVVVSTADPMVVDVAIVAVVTVVGVSGGVSRDCC